MMYSRSFLIYVMLQTRDVLFRVPHSRHNVVTGLSLNRAVHTLT